MLVGDLRVGLFSELYPVLPRRELLLLLLMSLVDLILGDLDLGDCLFSESLPVRPRR